MKKQDEPKYNLDVISLIISIAAILLNLVCLIFAP